MDSAVDNNDDMYIDWMLNVERGIYLKIQV